MDSCYSKIGHQSAFTPGGSPTQIDLESTSEPARSGTGQSPAGGGSLSAQKSEEQTASGSYEDWQRQSRKPAL